MDGTTFSESYGHWRTVQARETPENTPAVSEHTLQCVWYDRLFCETDLTTDDGRPLRILSTGWWNHGEGPDFRKAQLEIGGRLVTGDVEIHLEHRGWTQHGHQLDARYDEVVLAVALEPTSGTAAIKTASGRTVPRFSLAGKLSVDLDDLLGALDVDDAPTNGAERGSACQLAANVHGTDHLNRLLALAGDWRMLAKARALRERMDRVGADQAVYEVFLSACGFSHFKHHFRAIAQQLPYERVRQLGREDALLTETALLQIAELLPDALPEGTTAVPHFARLRGLRNDRLPGLRKLPLTWRRVGVRPNNNPERRLAGAARFLARTASKGLADTINELWMQDLAPTARREAFYALFPSPMGFWATHCTWTGKKMAKPSSPLGAARIQAIIGNVFVPAGLATARVRKNRVLEETVFNFFQGLSKEADNRILKRMIPRLFGRDARPRLRFRQQQGILQLYQDWCENNPSCRNCSVAGFLAPREEGSYEAG